MKLTKAIRRLFGAEKEEGDISQSLPPRSLTKGFDNNDVVPTNCLQPYKSNYLQPTKSSCLQLGGGKGHRFSEAQRRLLRLRAKELFDTGLSLVSVAKNMGVSKTTVHNLLCATGARNHNTLRKYSRQKDYGWTFKGKDFSFHASKEAKETLSSLSLDVKIPEKNLLAAMIVATMESYGELLRKRLPGCLTETALLSQVRSCVNTPLVKLV